MSARRELSSVVGAAVTARPETAEGLAAEIAGARAAGRTVLPVGDGSRIAAAGMPRQADVLLSTRGLGRVLEYEPADLTVTVEAGCTLAELDRVLAERGQVLPLQPGRARGTVGGLVATAPEGATALAYGGVRDSLIGVKAVLADGSIVRGGGRVVKNVAGYGVHRLMAGSHGTLGVIVEASFKVRPRPEAQATVLFEMETLEESLEAARRVLESGLEPVFVDVLTSYVTVTRLAVGFEGLEARVRAHLGRVVDIVAPSKPADHRVLTPDEDRSLRRTLDDWTGPDLELPGISGHVMLEAGRLEVLPLLHAILHVRVLPSRMSETLECLWFGIQKGRARMLLDVRPGLGSIMVLIESPDIRRISFAALMALEGGRRKGSAEILAAFVGSAGKSEGDEPGRDRRSPSEPVPSDFFLMKKIKQALDPDGVFASGGFVGGL